MPMKKLVGVMPLWDDEKESIWMLPGYLEGLAAAGADSFIFPLTTEKDELFRLTDLCDGILLTGGHDTNPALYGETPLNDSVVWSDVRDSMDQTVIHYALERNKKILGICRGIQILNVSLGGTLYQDLPTQYKSGIDHHMAAPYNRPCHEVNIIPDTPLFELLGKEKIKVNSIHHQAVRRLAPGLEKMAVSEDGLTEAVFMPDKYFVWGIQWHPEYWFKENEEAMAIFKCFSDHL